MNSQIRAYRQELSLIMLGCIMLKNDKERFVKQYHFTAWPDEGAPENGSGLLNYRQKVQGFNDGEDAPVIVHCR